MSERLSGEQDGGAPYALGFRDGLIQGLRAARAFQRGAPGPLATPALPMRFRSTGKHPAALSLAGRAGERGCALRAGYAAGWYSALLADTLLVREVACVERGARACRFEARSIEGWLERDAEWIEGLLPELRLEEVREQVERELGAPEAEPPGQFEAMCAAVQVWGPVMVLPYGGGEESREALAAVRSDPGCAEVEVAVVDFTGARVGRTEIGNVAALIGELQAAGIEPVLAALPPPTAACLRLADGQPAAPLVVPDVRAGIALAFQLRCPSGRAH
jgi:hypothetical protein